MARAERVLPLPLWTFVALMAGLMSLSALAIDVMLPAFDEIADAYGISGNAQQLVLFAFLAGYGFPQLVIGPLSDSLGRKGLLRVCLIAYTICGFACMAAPTFGALLAVRFVHGIASGGVRVLVTSIVRDLVEGRAMARVMSLVMTLFMIVPILAPALGLGVMELLNWRWTFGILGVAGVVIYAFSEWLLPETLEAGDRRDLNLERLAEGYGQVFRSRQTLGYMLASGTIFGCLFGYIGAAEQIYSIAFDQEARFVWWFGLGAVALACANFSNAFIVERIGMRRISHTVIFVFLGAAVANLIVQRATGGNFAAFFILFCIAFSSFGMIGANFSALAMQPLGRVAGTASAVYGFSTTTCAAGLGFLVSRRFAGTIDPILEGFVVLGFASLTILLITERGRLFQRGDGPIARRARLRD